MKKMICQFRLPVFLVCLVGLSQSLYAFEATPSNVAKTAEGENKNAVESMQVMNQLSDLKQSKNTAIAAKDAGDQLSKSGLNLPPRGKQPLVARELTSGNSFRKYAPPLKVVEVAKIYRVIPTQKILPSIPKVQKKDKDGKEVKSSDGSGNFTQVVAAQAEAVTPPKKEKARRWF